MRYWYRIGFLILFLAGCGIPASTPAIPSPELPVSPPPATSTTYPIQPWSAEQADRLIEELSQVDSSQPGAESSIRQALLLAIQEAQWRFPQAQQTENWNWLRASILAQDGESAAAQVYADWIASALNAGEVQLNDLSGWLQEQEPEGVFSQTTPAGFSGQQDHALVEFLLTGQPAYFWISRQADEYHISLLASSREFSLNHAVHVRLEWQDLTGDGQPEAWIIQTDSNRRIEMASLTIYDLGSGKAQRVQFFPALPLLPTGSWQILQEAGNAARLRIGLRVDDASALCEYLLPVEYTLQGLRYQRTQIEQPDLHELVKSGFSEAQARLCLDLSVDWLRANASGGDPIALKILEKLMPGFPFGADATLYVGLYPPDEVDRARFELGLSYARYGDLPGVQRWMSEIISRPAFEGSPWQEPAQRFLEAFQEGADLRRACLASHACLGSGRLNLNQLLALMLPEDWADPIDFLAQNGMALQQSGVADFNRDGDQETWWLESTRGAFDNLVILARLQDQPWLSRLSLPAGTGTLRIQPLEPLLGQPVYALQRDTQPVIFVYVSQEPAGVPEVWTLEQYRTQLRQTLYPLLLCGGDDNDRSRLLQALYESPYLNCKQPTEICQPSAQQAYLVALSLEYEGDTIAAAEAYQRVWQDFPESSYAILARARLTP